MTRGTDSPGAGRTGNEFGEPILAGFARSFGARYQQPDGSSERREWIKPILFTGGVGQIYDMHAEKGAPETGMLVVKLGEPSALARTPQNDWL